MNEVLRKLRSDELAEEIGFTTNAATVRLALLRSPLVRDAQDALSSGAASQADVDELLEQVHADFEPGRVSPDDIGLAALAVALAESACVFAQDYLRAFADLRVAELPFAGRVAAECLQALATERPTTQETDRHRALREDGQAVVSLFGSAAAPAGWRDKVEEAFNSPRPSNKVVPVRLAAVVAEEQESRLRWSQMQKAMAMS